MGALKKTHVTEFHREVDWEYYFNLPSKEKNKIYKDLAINLWRVSFNRGIDLGTERESRTFFNFKRMLEIDELARQRLSVGDQENFDFLHKVFNYYYIYNKNPYYKYRKELYEKRKTKYKINLVFKERVLRYV